MSKNPFTSGRKRISTNINDLQPKTPTKSITVFVERKSNILVIILKTFLHWGEGKVVRHNMKF